MVEVYDEALALFGSTKKQFLKFMKDNKYLPFVLQEGKLINYINQNMRSYNNNSFFKRMIN